jgi:hypothetical protein
MSALSDRLKDRRCDVDAVPEQQRQPDRSVTEAQSGPPLLWSRVMQEARSRALLLARRAFPWRYY